MFLYLMMDNTTILEDIYKEVKLINRKLDMLEDLIEKILIRDIPSVRLSDEEIEEIKKSIKEMKHGEYYTSEDLKSV